MGYTMNIVGEQHYQEAIIRASAGDPVTVAHEINNPFDPLSIVVIHDRSDLTIGYIPTGSFIHRLVFEEQKCVEAKISEIFDRQGFLEVKIFVEINHDDEAPEVNYRDRKEIKSSRGSMSTEHQAAYNISDLRMVPPPDEPEPEQPNTTYVAALGAAVIVLCLVALLAT